MESRYHQAMTTYDLARVGISILGLYFLVQAIVEMPRGGLELLPIFAGVMLIATDDWIAALLFGPRKSASG